MPESLARRTFERRASTTPRLLGSATANAAGLRRVLYIEDDPASIRLMGRLFETRSDLGLVAVRSLGVGREIAAYERFDLILLDVNLPEVRAMTAIGQLRSDQQFVRTPILAIGANGLPSNVRRACETGFDDYVTKPIDIGRLFRTLDRLTGERRPDPEAGSGALPDARRHDGR